MKDQITITFAKTLNLFVRNTSLCGLTYIPSVYFTQKTAMIQLKHKKLDVWKISVKLSTDIYKLTNEFPQNEQYGLTSQLRRASISISSNIAEGSARSSPKERRRFYEIARSSLVEIDTQLEIAERLNYLTDNNLKEVENKLNHTFAMLSNLIKSTYS